MEETLLISILDTLRMMLLQNTKKKWNKSMSVMTQVKQSRNKNRVQSIEELAEIYNPANSFEAQMARINSKRQKQIDALDEASDAFLERYNSLNEGEEINE